MIIIGEETTKNPLQVIGKYAGVCYGAKTDDVDKNIKRAYDCIKNNHGRTLELVDVYMIIDGYSAKFCRELYTHIGGAPTRLQSSTRYIDYAKKGLPCVIPPKIEANEETKEIYENCVKQIVEAAKLLEDKGIAKEDASMLLPLGMVSKMVWRGNLRCLIDMSHQRMCSRAFWEYRKFMKELCEKLSEVSDEWKWIVENSFKAKCELTGYCPETFGCGRKPKKEGENEN